jgi:hypothetical protein
MTAHATWLGTGTSIKKRRLYNDKLQEWGGQKHMVHSVPLQNYSGYSQVCGQYIFWANSSLFVPHSWLLGYGVVFNATFNNISVILWRSVLLVEETGVPGENHPLSASHWQTLSYNVVSSLHHLNVVRSHNFSGNNMTLINYLSVWRQTHHDI